jgi:predicted methyltransferase
MIGPKLRGLGLGSRTRRRLLAASPEYGNAVYKALKPGGVFLIVDHVAEAGSGMRDTDTLHRIDPAIGSGRVVWDCLH